MADERDDATPESSGLSQELWSQTAPLLPADSPQLYPGLELWGGRFQIVRRIGAGGMGVVHEAHDRERGENVALKTLSRMDAASIYRMKNEFRALAEVIHPNLVRLHELFADRRLWLFTMELVRGEPFLQWVRPQGVLDVRRLRHGLTQIVAGVRTIHDAGKLHRDLKPSNVLVTTNDRIVILDFGLVADPELGGPGQTMADDRVSGTPSYISPEQAAGDAPTTASDWYGVGVLLFEALTGRMPFPDRGYVVMQRKQSVEPPRASTIASEIPMDLDALCAALLSRLPQLRPTGEQIAAIASAQRHTPVPSAANLAALSMPPQPPAPNASLVGREAEFEALRNAFAMAAAGQAVVARVTGESGAGKSVLTRAFLDELRAQGRAVVLSGRCYERESVPYKAIDRVIDALTRFLRQLPDLEMATLMPRDIGALARIFPVLERIDLVAAAPARAAPDDQELRRRAFAAFTDLLAGIRDRHMLVLHVDDMQWIDHDSVLLLEHVLDQPDPPSLLLITGHRGSARDNPLLARIDQAVRGNRAVGLCEIAVGPLSRLAAHELASRLLQAANGDLALAGAVATESEGNPFFIAELARYAGLSGARGERHAVSLGDAIRRRAADLGDAARRLLELLAISARPTPGDVLVRASTGDDAHYALDLLRSAQLVREGGGRTYECYHDRIREAVTERLSPEATREHHLRLATAWSERANTDPELLFEHWQAAGQDARAAGCAVEAGQKAGSNLAFERSAAFYGHAARLLPDAETQRLMLREKRAEALSLAGRWAEAAQAFAESEALATEPAQRAHLLHQSAVHFLGSGQSAEGLPRLQRLFEINRVKWPTSRVGAALVSVARLIGLWLSGAKRPATPVAAKPEEAAALSRLLEGAGLVPPYDVARGVYFMTAFAARGLRCAETSYVAVACAMLATLFSASRFTRKLSQRLADEACVLARSSAQPDLASAALSFVGYSHLISDRTAEALALGVEAENLVRDSARAHIYQTWTARTLQSGALLVLGRIGEMAALCERNARLAREVGDEMALIGGDSPLRFLMTDDVERARALIEQKLMVLARAKDHGVLHQMVRVDQVLCGLYAGQGAEIMDMATNRGEGLARFFDPTMLAACAALQASPNVDPATRRIVKRTIRKLRRTDGPANEAMALHLEAVLCLRARDVESALAKINAAAGLYATASMSLHEALMRWRFGRLRGGAEGERALEQARRFMSAQGIVRPEGWARMLATGLE